MHKYQEHINERKKNRNNRNSQRGRQEQIDQFNKKFVLPQSNKMRLVISERFKYIITKMSESGNVVAKNLLKLCEQDLESYEMSYLDITPKEDSLSYLSPTANVGVKEQDKYKNNKRQYSKIYKVIKTIFGSRFTKNEVQKFVSLYKSVYNKGPEKIGPPKIEDTIKKMIKDTSEDKLKWNKTDITNQWLKFEASHKITEEKYLYFHYYIFFRENEKTMTFLSVFLHNNLGKTKDEKDIFIKSLKYKEVEELTNAIIKKFKINV